VRRPRRGREFASNPFVAFADITIALAFIFALSSVALSKVLSDVTRSESQDRFRTAVVEEVFGAGASLANVVDERDGLIIRDAFWVIASDGQKVGKIERNGSFQRIRLTNLYRTRADRLEPEARQRVFKLVSAVRAEMAAGKITYLQLHGIASKEEETRDYYLAGRRADHMFNDLVDAGLISRPGELSIVMADDKKINRLFVVPYGKAGLYQEAGDIGSARVDFVLYSAD
jgi:hypothetical protein